MRTEAGRHLGRKDRYIQLGRAGCRGDPPAGHESMRQLVSVGEGESVLLTGKARFNRHGFDRRSSSFHV